MVKGLQKPWRHAAPFGLGVMTGFMVWTYHTDRDQDTLVCRTFRQIENSGILRAIMHLSGLAIIVTVVVLYTPIVSNREDDNGVAFSFLNTASQTLLPIAFAMQLLPIIAGKSTILRS